MSGAPTDREHPIAAGFPPNADSARRQNPPENAEIAAARLEELLASVINAAKSSSLYWAILLFAIFYLFTTVRTINYYDLFLSQPVRLPVLNVDMPLAAFAWLAPLLFLVLHVAVLRRFGKIARAARDFDLELCSQKAARDERDQLRRHLPADICARFIAGPSRQRDGIPGLLLWSIAAVVLAIAPPALLIFVQLQFLPYHDVTITWWQRSIVLADLIILWRYWPRIGLPAVEIGSTGWPVHRGFVEGAQQFGTLGGTLLLTVVVGALALLIATLPGEWLETEFGSTPRIASARNWLVNGELDPITHRPASPWSDRLILPNLDPSASERRGLSLRGHHLEGAVFIGARLGPVDLTAAHLEGALLDSADLAGAVLDDARLEGASLKGTHLEGAVLHGTHLEGSILEDAHLQGALLQDVQLHGANLERAQLEAAMLERPQLYAASLVEAHLEGAQLDGAQLQEAALDRVHLSGSSLRDAFVWRSYIRLAEPSTVRVENIETAAKQLEAGRSVDWSAASWRALRQRIARESPRNTATMTALWRLDRVGQSPSPKEEEESAEQWRKLLSQPPAPAVYEAALAAIWQQIGCAREGAPHVMANMVQALTSPSSPFAQDSTQVSALAAAFLQADCAGAKGLPDAIRARLTVLRDRALPGPTAASPQTPLAATKPQ